MYPVFMGKILTRILSTPNAYTVSPSIGHRSSVQG
jgi:hypothetical protein